MKALENVKFFENATTSGVSEYEYYNINAEEITIDVRGTFVGTVVFEGKVDLNSPTYTPIAGINLSTYSVVQSGSVQSPGLYSVALSGVQRFRVNITSLTSGSVTVFGRAIRAGG